MNADTVKLWAAYGTAVVIAVGGLAAIIWMIFSGVLESQSGQIGLPILAAGVAGATGFLWAAESATRAEKAQARATEDVAKAAERVAAAGTGAGSGNASGGTP